MRFARIHLICRKLPTGNGFIGLEPCLHSRFDSAYISGKWSIAETDAQKLLGGLIFLHEAKTKTSQFGGLIYNWFKDPVPDKANPDRISFKFLAVTEGRYAEWGGRNFMMAWQSEVVPENEEITWNVPPLQRHVGKGFRSIADIPEDFISDLKQRSKVKIHQ
jgi:hypothetical protein